MKQELTSFDIEEQIRNHSSDPEVALKYAESLFKKSGKPEDYNNYLEDAISDYICEESEVAEFVPRQYIKKLYKVAEENVGSWKQDYKLFLELKKLVRIFKT